MANSSTAPPTTPARPLASSSPRTAGRQHLSSPSSNSLSSSASTVRRAGSHHSRPRSQPTAAVSVAAAAAVAVATLETGARSQATSANTNDSTASTTSSSDRRRRPSVAHNRSHSTSGAKEGVGNLNPRSLSSNSRKSSVSSTCNEREGALARTLSIEISSRVLRSLSPSKKHNRRKSKQSASSSASNSSPAKPKQAIHQVQVDILPPIVVSPSFAQEVTAIESSSRKQSIESSPLRLKTSPQSLQGPGLEGKPNSSPSNRKPPSPSSSKPTPSPKKTTRERQQNPPPEATTLKSQVFPRESAKKQKASKRVSVRAETERRGSTLNPGKNKHPSQKAMLSNALQKANTAVLLDNAQNYEGAVDAYGDACDLLQQVMIKTGEDEKRKLQAIRSTYTRRIVELKGLAPQFKAEEKALPARPEANELYDPDDLDNYNVDPETQSLSEDEEEDTIIETATVTRIFNDQSYVAEPREIRTLAPSLVPPRRESLQPSAFSGGEQYIPPSPSKQLYQQRPLAKSPIREEMVEIGNHLQSPMHVDCIPPPLSMRRATSPIKADQKQTGLTSPTNSSVSSREKDHSRANSTESTSWLDTIDESGGSSAASSVHSRSSSRVLRRKRLRAASGATADEFDAALDAAVEAAYDDGLVPASETDPAEGDMISIARRNVAVAKERVREAERETAIQFARERERRRLQNAARANARARSDSIEDAEYLEEEAEEEERLLEEMTRDYMIMGDFEFDLQSKSALPRESGSSGFSGRTWGSSIGSNFTTAGTSLQTVAEAPVIPSLPQRLQSKTPPPPHPPPSGALPAPPLPTSTPPPRPPPTAAPPRPPSAAAPRPPSAAASRPPSAAAPRPPSAGAPRPPSAAAPRPPSAAAPRPPSAAAPRPPSAAAPRPPSSAAPRPPSATGVQNQAQGIRSRRLSGQNPKQLKVETTKTAAALAGPLGDPPSLAPPKVLDDDVPTAPKSASSAIPPVRQLTPGPVMRPPTSATSQGMFRRESPQFTNSNFADPIPPPALSPGVSPLTRTMPQESDIAQARTGSPVRLSGKPSAGSGNLRLALSSSSLKNRNLSVSSPDGSEGSPGTPSNPFNPPGANIRRTYGQAAPPLPTPTSATVIPSSLTVGIAYFDTDIHSPYSPGSPNPMALNAPIPLEPCPSEYLLRPYWLMRCFYQTIVHNRGGYLSTKLFVPRDVWRVRGVKIKGMDEKISACDLLTAALLKLAKVNTDDADAVLEEMQALENILDQVQTSLSKKLGSEVGVQGSQSMFKEANDNMDSTGPKSSSSKSYLSWKRLRSKNSNAGLTSSFSTRDNSKENFSMSTLPMASAPVGRIPKRSVENVQFGGPNAHYLGSLARLFDAAQVLDQIARQVEDPGLKHSSQTQVGLELSTRHASEFFGFYICRFVLTDVSVLLDKFIKQGSEWVLV